MTYTLVNYYHLQSIWFHGKGYLTVHWFSFQENLEWCTRLTCSGIQLNCLLWKHSKVYLSNTIFTNASNICSAIPLGLFTPNDVDNLVDEVLKMHTLSHPNVMSLTGVCLDAGGGPAVVMPYMDNGSVLHYLKKERGKLVPLDDADCSVVCTIISNNHIFHNVSVKLKLTLL